MRVLYLGGTGEISYCCLEEGIRQGQEVFVCNRGRSEQALPEGVQALVGDVTDPATLQELAKQHWDVVCQFRAFQAEDARRDIDIFSGQVGQYVFISSASAYRKPPRPGSAGLIITEETPLENPYWAYSRGKIDCEQVLMQACQDGKLPVTIVRPSHTQRRQFPGTFGGGDNWAWRMLQGKSILVHGDGSSLWTLTRSEDFAVPFVRLLGHPAARGQAVHITRHLEAYAWDEIYLAMGQALGVEPKLVHVPTDTLVRYKGEWAGPLYGDKTWSVMFDNRKVTGLVGRWSCQVGLQEGMNRAAEHYRQRSAAYVPDMALHDLLDRIAAEQERLGR